MADEAPTKRSGRTIMLVDDDKLLLEHLELVLRDGGYEVVAVEDGEAALYQVSSVNPDLIILDSVMPRMDGPEVLNHLKADQGSATIPVMMLTARTASDRVQEAIKLGAEDYLAKPVDSGKLLERVKKLLEKADKRKGVDGPMDWKGGGKDFDLPQQKRSTRVYLTPSASEAEKK